MAREFHDLSQYITSIILWQSHVSKSEDCVRLNACAIVFVFVLPMKAYDHYVVAM
jgi:hypothetical protein